MKMYFVRVLVLFAVIVAFVPVGCTPSAPDTKDKTDTAAKPADKTPAPPAPPKPPKDAPTK
jgi:hypothetical protein